MGLRQGIAPAHGDKELFGVPVQHVATGSRQVGQQQVQSTITPQAEHLARRVVHATVPRRGEIAVALAVKHQVLGAQVDLGSVSPQLFVNRSRVRRHPQQAPLGVRHPKRPVLMHRDALRPTTGMGHLLPLPCPAQAQDPS